jgi:type I restriction-modification system DNA methylase subunit
MSRAKNEGARAFLTVLRELPRSRRADDHFEAALEALYIRQALSTDTCLGRERLEERLSKVLNPYDDADQAKIMSLGPIVSAEMAQGEQDFLGQIAGELAALNPQLGQFFSPYDLCHLNAALILGDARQVLRRNGYLTVGEPASGSGAMLIACADALAGMQIDITRDVLFDASDVSAIAYWMAYLQLSARGVPAVVRRRNSLTLEQFEHQFTPSFTTFWGAHGEAFLANSEIA